MDVCRCHGILRTLKNSNLNYGCSVRKTGGRPLKAANTFWQCLATADFILLHELLFSR